MHGNDSITSTGEANIPHLSQAIDLLRDSTFQRVSNTIKHTVSPNPGVIMSVFDDLSQFYPDIYRVVLDQGVLELGCGCSYPNGRFFDKHPVNNYIGIDLAREIGTQGKIDIFGRSTRYIRGGVDMFAYLERLPDNSVPYCFLSFLDEYIMNGEEGRLSDLLDRKVQNNIFVYDSAVRGNKVIGFSLRFS